GILDGLISGMHLDHAGRLWMTSSSSGLSRIDDPTAEHPHFARYTTAEGLSSNNARCVTEDLRGNIYAGTVSGVDRLNPATGLITHYTVADGLAADFVNVAYRDHAGALWFGTPAGLSRLVPPQADPPTPPRILISGLLI